MEENPKIDYGMPGPHLFNFNGKEDIKKGYEKIIIRINKT